MTVHPAALVDPGARLAPDVEVGPGSLIGPGVEIGAGTRVGAHVILEGRTRIGQRNVISHYAAIGGAPQDKKYGGEDTAVEIGDDNTIREYVTINRGTAQDAGTTRVGDGNWIMAYVHFAHDCQIGNRTIVANACQLAGHVHVGDWAVLGATTLVHQFVRIGMHAFTGMGSFLSQDLPPYVKAAGNVARPYGLNSEGLRRRGFTPEALRALKHAYRALYRDGLSLEAALERLRELGRNHPDVLPLADFVAASSRGIIR